MLNTMQQPEERSVKYKALALDLDGTLTNSKKELSNENKRAVQEAIAEGVTVILASGRPVFGITPIAQELELDKIGGYILAYNGGSIIDCQTGQVMYSRILAKEAIHDICSLARKYDVYALTYDGDIIVSESDDDPYVQKECTCNHATVKKVQDLESYVDYPVPKFLVVGEHQKLLPLRDELLALHGDIIDAFFSEDYFLEVVPKNVAKDVALDHLLKKVGINRRELIACGDGMNDIPMLEYAGLGVAMQNAYPKVKESAQFIASSNDENGVQQVIAKYIL